MYKSFVVSQKSHKQNLNEQHHLIARAMNGLTSDRYKKTDYDAFKNFTKKELEKTKEADNKLNQLKKHISTKSEDNFVKKQNQIWSNSFQNLKTQINSSEKDYESSLELFFKNLKILDKEDFVNVKSHIENVNISLQSYDDSIVEPMRCLKLDLKFKLSQGHSGSDNLEVKKQVDRLKYQAFKAVCQEENNWYKLEEDLEHLRNLNQDSIIPPQKIKDLFKIEEYDLIESFGILEMIQTELNSLYKNLEEQISSCICEVELIHKKQEKSLWSPKELMFLSHVSEVIKIHIPKHLKKNSTLLQLEMLSRILPKKSKLQILEAEVDQMKIRFENNRLKRFPEEYHTQLEILRNKTLNSLFDAIEKQQENEKIQLNKEEQRKICFQLHSQLQIMKAKRMEIQRIEEQLEKIQKEKFLEEKKNISELNNKRRKEIHSKIASFKLKKAKEKMEKENLIQMQLQNFKLDLKKQLEYDKTRVKVREDMYSDKLKVQAEEKREKELEKLEREQRLEALAATVAPTVEANTKRAVQNTISYNKKRGVGEINQDINLQQPLFTTFTFTDQQIKKDARVRVERELRKMNLLETDYARKILSKVTPPSKPRRDNFSTIFKDTS